MHPVEALLSPLGKLFARRHADPAKALVARPEFASSAGAAFALTSPAFAEGGTIPARYCGRFIGENISPELEWDGAPEATRGLLLVVDDLDVPTEVPGLHVIAAFAPETMTPSGRLPEGAAGSGSAGVSFVPNHRGVAGYVGPRPLPGHGPHHYRFHLFALDTQLDLTGVPDAAALPAAVAGHVLATAVLTGIRES